MNSCNPTLQNNRLRVGGFRMKNQIRRTKTTQRPPHEIFERVTVCFPGSVTRNKPEEAAMDGHPPVLLDNRG